jgi:two-component system, chemotaxis family, response regulator Rcp1
MRRLVIYVAEDNPPDVWLIRQALNERGVEYELHVAEDGERAAELLDRSASGEIPKPDVVLADFNLPRAEGVEVLRLFREHPASASAPLIVITSSDAPADRSEAAALGAAAYFRKPSQWEEFVKLGDLVRSVAG